MGYLPSQLGLAAGAAASRGLFGRVNPTALRHGTRRRRADFTRNPGSKHLPLRLGGGSGRHPDGNEERGSGRGTAGGVKTRNRRDDGLFRFLGEQACGDGDRHVADGEMGLEEEDVMEVGEDAVVLESGIMAITHGVRAMERQRHEDPESCESPPLGLSHDVAERWVVHRSKPGSPQ